MKLYGLVQDFPSESFVNFGERTGCEQPGREDVVQSVADVSRNFLEARFILTERRQRCQHLRSPYVGLLMLCNISVREVLRSYVRVKLTLYPTSSPHALFNLFQDSLLLYSNTHWVIMLEDKII